MKLKASAAIAVFVVATAAALSTAKSDTTSDKGKNAREIQMFA